eukprot:CAMPEP_0170487890 /NCGR_PEP_ID=MMETSP0208-20121228/6600_1 /TAXON_ID=197538 /ORGANISM="Strombidium inclinatum, Strain S3" /LENGTH=121 /DNA_ID=CAMNT_0010762317 /DNA_START=261 /DNA_END=626 /DNA_ORIENTATION=+
MTTDYDVKAAYEIAPFNEDNWLALHFIPFLQAFFTLEFSLDLVFMTVWLTNDFLVGRLDLFDAVVNLDFHNLTETCFSLYSYLTSLTFESYIEIEMKECDFGLFALIMAIVNNNSAAEEEK